MPRQLDSREILNSTMEKHIYGELQVKMLRKCHVLHGTTLLLTNQIKGLSFLSFPIALKGCGISWKASNIESSRYTGFDKYTDTPGI